jgi:hypothetical protein
LARKANYKSFEDLGIQVLGVSSNTTFSQQTFAESLKLPYPLLSDYPDRKVIRAYGILNERAMIAVRTFFLIDPQGVIRKKCPREPGRRSIATPCGISKDRRKAVTMRVCSCGTPLLPTVIRCGRRSSAPESLNLVGSPSLPTAPHQRG